MTEFTVHLANRPGQLATLARLLADAGVHIEALAAFANGELGVVRLVADPDYTRAEYAVLVRSDLKGRGLGWLLMQHLIAYAKAEKLEQLHGSVLTGNTMMLQMCRDLGFSIEREPDDSSIRHVVLQLA